MLILVQMDAVDSAGGRDRGGIEEFTPVILNHTFECLGQPNTFVGRG